MALLTKCCGKNCHVFLKRSKNNFTFFATTACVSLSALVKINAKGEKIWDKAFGGSDNDVLNAAVPTPDGGFLLGSWANSNQSGDKSENSRGDYDYWIIKVK